jgi:carbon-monoxide dehydrogenase large subunit
MTVAAPKRSNAYVGSPIERVEDLRFLTGRGQYVGDLTRDGLWHAAVIRSSVAHGRINGIDASHALTMPGVHAVLTARDIGPTPKIPLRTTLPSYLPYAQSVIADGVVRYVGEPVALLLADSAELAEDAAETVELDIEPLPVVMRWDQSLKGDLLLIDGTTTNVAGNHMARCGDAAAAFAAAPYKRRESFRVHRHMAMPMETRGVLAEWDNERQHLTVHGAAKAPFFNRKSLAKLLDMPEASIDCIECDVGGGFGARGEVYPEDFLLAFAARKFRRPIKWIEDRREHFMAMNHSREIDAELEIACTRDGTLLALRGSAYIDCGAYIRPSSITSVRNIATFMAGAYRIPNFEVQGLALLTNKTPAGVFRGPGRYESCFFFERLMDMAADDLKLDRLAFRRRNLVTSDEMPYPLAKLEPSESPDGFLDSGHYPATLDACAEDFGWQDKLALNGKFIDGRWHGIGMACFVEGGAAGPRENVRLEIEKDGSVTLYSGSSAIGQGLETVMSQITADALEIPMERIRVLHGSTNLLHEGFGSFASRATVMGGNAVMVAAKALLDIVRSAAAERFQLPPDAILVAGGIASAPDGRNLSFADLADLELKADGSFANSKATYTYGASMAHVAVDPATGQTQLLQYQAVDDVGRAINPLTLHGQVIGAAVQGLGGVFSEDLPYDENGQLLVGSFVEYVMPVATDYPNIHARTMELYPSPNNPLGAKGAGEGGIIPVAGAVSNAVAAALAPLGVTIRDLPLTSSRVWEMIQAAKGG